MIRTQGRWIAIALTGLLVASWPSLVESRERSSKGRSAAVKSSSARSAPRSSARSTARTSAVRTGARTSSGRTVARGTPSYGYHGRHGRGSYARYGYYGGYYPYYYRPYGYWYGYWGYPFWGGYWYGAPSTVRLVEVDSARRPAVVETDVRPKKAEIWVDGEFRGQARDFNGTWDLLYLEPGTRTIEFRREGYKSLRIELNARAGLHLRIDDRLEKGDGFVEKAVDLPEPERTDEAAMTAADSGEPRFELAPESPSLREGLLRISASPPDAAVYLDGEFLANATELSRLHGALPVAVGRHVIEVVRPGYRGVERTITVEGEEPTRIEIDLERESDGEPEAD